MYVSPDTVALGIRGTDPKNPEDLLSDVHILTSTLKVSRRYREIAARFKQLKKEFPDKKKVIIGHSLGGSLASQLLVDYIDDIHAIYVYNPGAVPSDIVKGLKTRLFAALGVKFYKKLKRKTHLFHVKGDIISFLSRFHAGTHKDVKQDSSNPHSVENFTIGVAPHTPPAAIEPVIEPVNDVITQTKGAAPHTPPEAIEPVSGRGMDHSAQPADYSVDPKLWKLYNKMSRVELIHLLAKCRISGHNLSKNEILKILKCIPVSSRHASKLLKRHQIGN